MVRTKNKTKSLILRIFLFSSIVICAIGTFYFTYSYLINGSRNNYVNNIKLYIGKIDDANKNFSINPKDKNFDSEKLTKDMNNRIDSLSKIKTAIASTNPPEKLADSHQNLIQGTDSNILIYKNIKSLLNTTNTAEMEDCLNELRQKRDLCMDCYSLVNINNSEIVLNDQAIQFTEDVAAFIENKLSENQKKQLKDKQNTDFVYQIDKIVNKFLKNKVNFSSNLIELREKKGQFSSLLDSIDNNRAELLNIKKEFHVIKIPAQASQLAQCLDDMLNSYDIYLQNFKYAVVNEFSHPNNLSADKNSLNSLYEKSEEIFKETSNYYDKFSKLLNDFKNQNLS